MLTKKAKLKKNMIENFSSFSSTQIQKKVADQKCRVEKRENLPKICMKGRGILNNNKCERYTYIYLGI